MPLGSGASCRWLALLLHINHVIRVDVYKIWLVTLTFAQTPDSRLCLPPPYLWIRGLCRSLVGETFWLKAQASWLDALRCSSLGCSLAPGGRHVGLRGSSPAGFGDRPLPANLLSFK